MSFDLESEASLGPVNPRGPVMSHGSRSRFTLASRTRPLGYPEPLNDIEVEDEQRDGLPELSKSVSSRTSSRPSRKLPAQVADVASRVSGAYAPSYSREPKHVRTSSRASVGNDERHRSAVYPLHAVTPGDEVSPYDSISRVGAVQKRNDAEFISEQRSHRASKSAGALASELAATTDRLPPQARRRLSTSSGDRQVPLGRPETPVATPSVVQRTSARGSKVNVIPSQAGSVPSPPQPSLRPIHYSNGAVRTRRSNVSPNDQVGAPLSVVGSDVTQSPRIIVDKEVLQDMVSVAVSDDINIQVLGGKNVIVLQDGGSFEVIDTNGDPVEPVHFDTRSQARELGFLPVTPRDLHDRLKRSSDGKLSLVKQGGDYRVVNSGATSAGKPRRALEMRDNPRWKRMFTPL